MDVLIRINQSNLINQSNRTTIFNKQTPVWFIKLQTLIES